VYTETNWLCGQSAARLGSEHATAARSDDLADAPRADVFHGALAAVAGFDARVGALAVAGWRARRDVCGWLCRRGDPCAADRRTARRAHDRACRAGDVRDDEPAVR